MDKEILKRQRSKGLGSVAIYSCKNEACGECFKGTCVAIKQTCINCDKRIKPR